MHAKRDSRDSEPAGFGLSKHLRAVWRARRSNRRKQVNVVEALLYLADIELGAPSALRDHLQHGVAVHTSALLREEQRASEIAFELGNATAMYATGTMAQGLNLPATAVVIGGTEIGYDTTSSLQQRRDQTRAQLLNAIGRAGRAHIAPRSMAVVVPNKALVLSSAADAHKAVQRAEFLQDEDASSELTSALDGLIADVISGELAVDTLTAAEHTAFSFLTFEDSDEDETRQVVAKTWAVHRAHAEPLVSEITRGLATAGNAFLQAADAPSWVALAAHQSGIALPETASLYHGLRAQLTAAPGPDTIPDWADVMLDLLSQLSGPQLRRLLPNAPYGTSRLANIYSDDNTVRTRSWAAYRTALRARLVGDPIISIADHIHAKSVAASAKRGPQDPIPRTIAITSDAFRFGLTLVAGVLAAITTLGREHDSNGPRHLPDDAFRTLTLLPLAVRSGASTPEVLGWIRAGVHSRVAAHQLNQVLPASPGQSDEDLRRWAYGRLNELIDGAMPGLTTAEEERMVEALRLVRGAR
ncbi:hypothetical protein ACGFJ7_35720 [Actinoplanes sp. NPDC048988]|uniref:hypothetical protein n=1 Tax=Actinoplanes sp. NPDC048988 TaxID=3363901 RepID=UPI003723A819